MVPRDRLLNRYAINFVHYKTNFVQVFLGTHKDKAAKKFEEFVVHFERRFNCKVLVLRTDGGGEYKTIDLFCKNLGIGRQVTQPGTAASNGKSERMHRTLFNMARTMLFCSGLATKFWGDAVQYAAYVLNRSPTRANPKNASPLEMLYGKAPDVSKIVRFGSICDVHIAPSGSNFKSRSEQGRIIGIGEETKGYRVILERTGKVVVTRDVTKIVTLSPEQNDALRTCQDHDYDAPVAPARETPPPATKQKKQPWQREPVGTRS